MDEKLTYRDGNIIWKCSAEYNPDGALHGMPYYYITKVDKKNYLWKYDIEKQDYKLIKSSDDFTSLWEEGMKLGDEMIERMYLL